MQLTKPNAMQYNSFAFILLKGFSNLLSTPTNINRDTVLTGEL